MQAAFAAPAPIAVHRSAKRRPRPPSATRAFTEGPSSSSSSRPRPASLPLKSPPPSPWLQAALLTIFEPVPEKPHEPPPPPESITKWQAVWQSLVALYALRFRLGPRRAVPPPPVISRPPDVLDGDAETGRKLFLVETPRFYDATGVDAARVVSRVIVCIADLLADAVVIDILSRISKPTDVVDIGLGVVAAYATADLVSTLYNWLRLNFSPNSVVFGERTTPGADTPARSFSKLVAPHCAAVAPCFAFMLASPPGELAGDAFVCYFLTFVSLLPAFGEWSGGDNRVPRVISMLQSAGVMVRRSSEASLHRLEYGLVCGVWDSFLKRLRIFSALERWIYIHSGGRIRPKVWDIVPEARIRACGLNDELLAGMKRDEDK